MRFEWDSKKAEENLKKHGVPFEEAASIFYDPLSATFEDPDHSINEYRFLAVGLSSHSRLLVVAYAERGENIRIISARPATGHERKRHEE